MREILLTRGYVALVDDKDYERVSAFKWYASVKDHRRVVAISGKRVNGRTKHTVMHRFLLGVTDPKILVDHKNGNTLDNTRANLRPCTSAQNSKNYRKTTKKKTSQFKGVCFTGRALLRPWVAQIRIGGKPTNLGYFPDENEAAKAYDAAARKHYGEFALCNFSSLEVAA